MPSLAERATISAQETVRAHSFSTAALILFTYLKFLIPKLLSDSFSDSTPTTVSKSKDASQAYTYKSYFSVSFSLTLFFVLEFYLILNLKSDLIAQSKLMHLSND